MTLYTNIDSNKRKTALYLGFFLLFVIAFGWLLSYVLDTPAILYFAIAISVIQALLAYYSGDKVALAVSGATAHLYISDPLGKKKFYFAKLFSTHPPIAERIAALKGMEI